MSAPVHIDNRLPGIRFESVPYEQYRTSGGNSYVHLPDGWTNYELSGNLSSPTTVVLIHGGTIPLDIWQPQMAALQQANVRILRYDQFGRGFSERPAAKSGRDLFVRQLKTLLDALHIADPVTLVGPSFGGAIAVAFAARYPDRVSSMVLQSPALNLLTADSPLRPMIKLLRLPLAGELLYRLFLRAKIIERGRALIPGGNGSPCDIAFINQFTCRGTERCLFSTFRSDAYESYRELTRKAGEAVSHLLLLRGEHDTEITRRMIGEIHADLPRARFITMENCGHGAGGEAAEEFNKLLLAFLAEPPVKFKPPKRA